VSPSEGSTQTKTHSADSSPVSNTQHVLPSFPDNLGANPVPFPKTGFDFFPHGRPVVAGSTAESFSILLLVFLLPTFIYALVHPLAQASGSPFTQDPDMVTSQDIVFSDVAQQASVDGLVILGDDGAPLFDYPHVLQNTPGNFSPPILDHSAGSLIDELEEVLVSPQDLIVESRSIASHTRVE
jgi:hypothetical protein